MNPFLHLWQAIRPTMLVIIWSCFVLAGHAATFTNNASAVLFDSSNGLSWNASDRRLSVSCWFKLSVPSGVPLTNDLVIIVNQSSYSPSTNFAYLIRYSIANGNVEFVAKGTTDSFTNSLIQRPYLDRWYHVAITRRDDGFAGYVDGYQVFSISKVIGSSASGSPGLSVGGWGSGRYLYGEVQEVSVYASELTGPAIRQRMFSDTPTTLTDLRAYLKLAYSPNIPDRLANFAAYCPPGTDAAVKQGGGTILFEETDEAGEQSLFDSRKNRGENAIVPLSGSYSWEQMAFSRQTPGIAFEFRFGYFSANAFSSVRFGQNFNPFEFPPLSAGWRHSFEMRVLPGQYFDPTGSGPNTLGLMNWDGSIETWELDSQSNTYKTRHKEYRGELTIPDNLTCIWTSPERLVYKFSHPFIGTNETMFGRLLEIRDFNSNSVKIGWDQVNGVVTQAIDSANGVYNFNYSGSLLTSVTFGLWGINFTYATNRLVTKTFSGPADYTPRNTTWRFSYNTNGLLERVLDPMNYTNVVVTYDSYGRQTNVVNALGYSKPTEYISDKRQICRTDPDGFKWVETFDRKGRPVNKTDPLGHVTSISYDGVGNVISVTEPLGYKKLFAYDERANKIAETNDLGQVTQWQYHPLFNKPIQEVNPLGWTLNYTYDDDGNLVSNYDSLGTIVSYTYASNGLVQTATDANGNTSHFGYDTNGFLVSKTDPASNVWNYSRNDVGWMLSVTNPLSEVTRYAFDINGNTVQTVDALPRTYTRAYDSNGNLTSQSDANGHFTSYAYNPLNQRTQVVDRIGATWTTSYTKRGEVLAVINPDGIAITNSYDAVNRLTKSTDPLGSIQYEYDDNNNRTAVIDKLTNRWNAAFDHLNRVIGTSDPLGNTTQTAYDELGRVKIITSPKGYPSVHDYDGRGRLIRWTDAEGYVWHYDYDGVGNITNITDALNGHYVMAYGNRNERILERNQDEREWQYNYDKLGRLKTQNAPNGIGRTFAYDTGGRRVSIAFSSGRVDQFDYDNNDNILTAARSGSGSPNTTHIEYDSMDRVTGFSNPNWFSSPTSWQLFTCSRDIMGRKTHMQLPGREIWYRYDSLKRLTNIAYSGGYEMHYTYDAIGRLLTREFPNHVIQTNSYDSASRLTSLTYSQSSGSARIALNYAYDRNGNKTSSTEQGTLNWSSPAVTDETAWYTPSGRLIDRNISQIAPSNSLQTIDYRYDPSGNMTNASGNGQTWALTYDEDNRVTSVRWDIGALTSKIITNQFDAFGRRISQAILDQGTETRYILDITTEMESILWDIDGSGQLITSYIHGPGGLGFSLGNFTRALKCYHSDAQGNIIAITDGSGNRVAQYAYTPYGRSLPGSTVDSNPYRFVGAYGVMEELPDLFFMRARYYSAQAGVFLSTDPVKHIGPGWKPASFVYGNDNPLESIDPAGTDAINPIDMLSWGKYAYGAIRYGRSEMSGEADSTDRVKIGASTVSEGIKLALRGAELSSSQAAVVSAVSGIGWLVFGLEVTKQLSDNYYSGNYQIGGVLTSGTTLDVNTKTEGGNGSQSQMSQRAPGAGAYGANVSNNTQPNTPPPTQQKSPTADLHQGIQNATQTVISWGQKLISSATQSATSTIDAIGNLFGGGGGSGGGNHNHGGGGSSSSGGSGSSGGGGGGSNMSGGNGGGSSGGGGGGGNSGGGGSSGGGSFWNKVKSWFKKWF